MTTATLPPLSPRQLQVLQQYAECGSYKIGASALDISVNTFKIHASRIRKHLDICSTTEAVTIAFREGWIR